MELGKEIKQAKFNDEYQKAMLNVLYTGNWVNSMHTRFFKQYSISPQQYNILRILKGQHPKPASVNLLIERMLDKMSNASRLVEKLRQKKLVKRNVSEIDRRQVDVSLTEKGMLLLENIQKDEVVLEACFRNLSEEEVFFLNKILDKIRG
jgi:DNA-binding MarR family transcriptional regulator